MLKRHKHTWRYFLSTNTVDTDVVDESAIDVEDFALDVLGVTKHLKGYVCEACGSMQVKIYDDNGALMMIDTRNPNGRQRLIYAKGLSAAQKEQAHRIKERELQVLADHDGPGIYVKK